MILVQQRGRRAANPGAPGGPAGRVEHHGRVRGFCRRTRDYGRVRGFCRRTRDYGRQLRLSAYGAMPVIGQVEVTPTTSGLPGGELAQKLLDWLAQGALWGCLGAVLVGSLVWGLSARAGNSLQAGTGKSFAIGGAIGALIAGLAPTIINTFFNEAA